MQTNQKQDPTIVQSYRDLAKKFTFFGLHRAMLLPVLVVLIGAPTVSFHVFSSFALKICFGVVFPVLFYGLLFWWQSLPKKAIKDFFVARYSKTFLDCWDARYPNEKRPQSVLDKVSAHLWTSFLNMRDLYEGDVQGKEGEEGMLLKEGSKGVLFFDLIPQYIDMASPFEKESLHNDIHKLLGSLDESYRYGITYYPSGDFHTLLETYQQSNPDRPLVSCLREAHAESLTAQSRANKLHKWRVVLEVEFTVPASVRKVYWGGWQETVALKENLQKINRKIKHLRENIISDFEGCGFVCNPLDNTQIYRLLAESVTPEIFAFKDRKIAWNPITPLKHSLGRSTRHLDDEMKKSNMFNMHEQLAGSWYHGVLTLRELPVRMGFGDMTRLIKKINTSRFTLKVTFRKPSQKKELDHYKKESKHTQNALSMKDKTDREGNKKIESTEEAINTMLSGKDKMFYATIAIRVWNEDRFVLSEELHALEQTMESIQGMQGYIEKNPFDMWIHTMPGQREETKREIPLQGRLLTNFLPVLGGYSNDEAEPEMVFHTEAFGKESIVQVDTMSLGLENGNGTVIGTPGSGKSNLAQKQILCVHQIPKSLIFMFETKDGFNKIFRRLGGQIVDWSDSSNLPIINPFEFKKVDFSPGKIEEKKAEIQFVLETMLTGAGKDGDEGRSLPEHTSSLLNKALTFFSETFDREKTSEITLPYFIDLLRSEAFEDWLRENRAYHDEVSRTLRRIALTLDDYTTGFKGQFFTKPSTVDFDNDLMYFSLSGLTRDPDLEAVIFFSVLRKIWDITKLDKNQRVFIGLDEAWRQFSGSKETQKWVEDMYRTIRSYNGSIWAYTQDADNMMENKAGRTALACSSNKIYLKQSKFDSFYKHKEALGLTDEAIEKIKTFKTVKGEYADLLLIQKDDTTVVKKECCLRSRPWCFEEYWLTTTNPLDENLFACYKAVYSDEAEALKQIAEDEKAFREAHKKTGFRRTDLIQHLSKEIGLREAKAQVKQDELLTV